MTFHTRAAASLVASCAEINKSKDVLDTVQQQSRYSGIQQ